MDNSMVWTERECSQVRSYCSVKYSCLLEHIAQVDVGIEECGVKLNRLRNGLKLEVKTEYKSELMWSKPFQNDEWPAISLLECCRHSPSCSMPLRN